MESTTKAYDYELKAWLDKGRTQSATFFIREPGPEEYMMAKSYIDQGKDIEGVYMLVKSLLAPACQSDDPIVIAKNLVAFKSVEKLVMTLMQPVEGELKKS